MLTSKTVFSAVLVMMCVSVACVIYLVTSAAGASPLPEMTASSHQALSLEDWRRLAKAD